MSIFRAFPSLKASAMLFPHRDDERLNVMSASTNMDSNLAAFREDRGELKRDVASLIEHFRDEATNRVQNAAAQIDRAGKERRFLGRVVKNGLPA
jgi:hypothetical protein